LATAEAYLAAGGYRWNAGIFCWRADVVLRELTTHCAWLMEALAPLKTAWGSPRWEQVLVEVYQPLKRVSIDYALMEHAKSIAVVTGRFTWDDVGSWDSLYDHLPADADGVITRGDVIAQDCTDSLILADSGQLIAAVGLNGISVVATNDAILVIPKGRSQDVKRIVDDLKAKGRTALI
jgi:mannose-1-phosphate guanylyltransferase